MGPWIHVWRALPRSMGPWNLARAAHGGSMSPRSETSTRGGDQWAPKSRSAEPVRASWAHDPGPAEPRCFPWAHGSRLRVAAPLRGGDASISFNAGGPSFTEARLVDAIPSDHESGAETTALLEVEMAARTVLSVLVGLLLAGSALAAPGSGRQGSSRPSTPIRNILVLSCDIEPAAVPGSGQFQATEATVTVASGSLTAGRIVEIHLGNASGDTIGEICTDNFGRTSASTTVTIAPAITDPNYNWRCAAQQTSRACQIPH